MRVDRGYCTPSTCCDIANLVNWSKSHGSSRMCIHFHLQTFLLGSCSGARSRKGRWLLVVPLPWQLVFSSGLSDLACTVRLCWHWPVAISSGCSHLASLCALLHPLNGETEKGRGGVGWRVNMCTYCRQTGRRGKGTTRDSPCPSQERKQGQVHI